MKAKYLLMITVVLLAMFVVPVAADDTSDGTSRVEYQYGVSYTLTVPPTIPVQKTDDGVTGTAEIKLTNCIIEPWSIISVTMVSENGQYLIHSTINDDLDYDVYSSTGERIFDGGVVLSIQSDGTIPSNQYRLPSKTEEIKFIVYGNPLIAGSYSDTLTFYVDTSYIPTNMEDLTFEPDSTGTVSIAAGNYQGSISSIGDGVTTIQGSVDGEGNPTTTLSNPDGELLSMASIDGVTFKNLKLTGKSILESGYASGVVTFENCVIEPITPSTDAVHFDSGSETGTVKFIDCTIAGLNKFGTSVEFEGCTFITKGGNYGSLSFHNNAKITNCIFSTPDFKEIRAQNGATVTISNSKLSDETQITSTSGILTNFGGSFTVTP